MKAPKSATAFIAVGMLLLLVQLGWMIHLLSNSSGVCGAIIGAGKVAGAIDANLASTCFDILKQNYGYVGWVALGELAVIGLSFVVVTITDRNASIDVHGPGGISLRADSDNVAVEANLGQNQGQQQ